MFKITNALLAVNNKGLVWKKKAWTQSRKRRARVMKNALDNVDASLRLPYVTRETVVNAKLTQQQIYQRIYGFPRSYADMVDEALRNSSKNSK
jgi:hypothetical protein